MPIKNNYENELSLEAKSRKITTEFINIVHDLWYEKSIELVIFRNSLIDKRASEVLNLVSYAKKFINKPISISDILEISQYIRELDLPPSKLDIGKLVYEYHSNSSKKIRQKIIY
jgi:glyceraldehyde 3-phosphate dehydrogenase